MEVGLWGDEILPYLVSYWDLSYSLSGNTLLLSIGSAPVDAHRQGPRGRCIPAPSHTPLPTTPHKAAQSPEHLDFLPGLSSGGNLEASGGGSKSPLFCPLQGSSSEQPGEECFRPL